ncbi:hypothetical protein [Rhodococcus erythropolis]|uniref:hypothetical protein n=1 Tax=Rhodococcus erythropolis TaxID=1833 RepID=UPI0003156B76|nr:hypothetical protein [Rhodococcus erythropolis]
MIIVLDSSALTRGARFDAAIADARALGHRVVVPRLGVLEVASRYREESAEMIAALSVQARMYDRLGLRRDLTRFVDAAHDKADGYVDDVIEDLVAIGVEVVDPVDVSHLEVAERAISLRRPYTEEEARRLPGDAELADRARSRRPQPGGRRHLGQFRRTGIWRRRRRGLARGSRA